MNDLELLRQFTQDGSQAAFATLVTRHLGLVYSAARRQLRSPDLAQEAAQLAFLDLAASAHQLRPDTHLASWLYVATRRRAIDIVRREASRRRWEQAAAEVDAMKERPAAWAELEPLLDEVLGSLNEDDRRAILLRFFENQSLGDISRVLGCTTDAAQKRVSRALERLRSGLARRGIATVVAALAADLSAQAVRPVPGGLDVTISAAVASRGGAIAAASHQAARALGTGTLQRVAVAMALSGAIGFAVFQTYVRHRRQRQIVELQSLANTWQGDVQRLRREQPRSAAAVATAAPVASGDADFDARVQAVLKRVAQVKQRFAQNPAQQIPELNFLSDSDWFGVVQEQAQWATDDDWRAALGSTRTRAKNRFLPELRTALKAYLAATAGQLPADVGQLAPYFKTPVDVAMLARYEMRATGAADRLGDRDAVIAERADSAIDPPYDNLGVLLGLGNQGMRSAMIYQSLPDLPMMESAVKEARQGYRAAHDGQEPPEDDVKVLGPYFSSPDLAAKVVQTQMALVNPLQFSHPNAVGTAMNLYRVAHHGAYAAGPDELAPYFQDPYDAAKYLLATKGWSRP